MRGPRAVCTNVLRCEQRQGDEGDKMCENAKVIPLATDRVARTIEGDIDRNKEIITER